jgi:uncharacterized membrane protein YsdA (DUF1294 family)/cold shock CspA family protein
MRFQGRIIEWNDVRGYGFVSSDERKEKAFVHISAFPQGSRRPIKGDLITYLLTSDDRGRPRASSIEFVSSGANGANLAYGISLRLCVVTCFFVFVSGAAFLKRIPTPVPFLYLIASLITFGAYAIDKSAAQDNRPRIPEKFLHLLELAGGWPGALIAQRKLHHKSKKISFRIVFWFIVVINCAILGWLFTKQGSTCIQTFVAALRQVV